MTLKIDLTKCDSHFAPAMGDQPSRIFFKSENNIVNIHGHSVGKAKIYLTLDANGLDVYEDALFLGEVNVNVEDMTRIK